MKTIKDLNIDGKKVIIRCDLNVPMMDNVITDDTRIKASLKTIKYALDIAEAGDTVVLAGKGHETYQVIGTQRVHYDEREVVQAALKK